MTQPAPDTFLSTDHDTASPQLWGRMEGRYRMIRRDYNLPYDRMVCIGYSDIVSGVPRDPQYSAELFQKSAYLLEHDDGDFGIEQENRIFRLKDGKIWSIWSVGVGDGDLIRTKVADLDFGSPIEVPSGGEQQTSLRMVDQGRMEADGSHCLTIDFFMGIRPHWQLIGKLNDGTGSVPSQCCQ
ncbi:hypothetical protein LTR16_001135 [Cryomyces antarcticus]|uniref:Uncharacterized protein n=1 Tax=Cryomyces antarcticus TaxID=329879 RepID=A0ABR0M8F3_9PEZI|nr:hypothetical protein LTR39_000696 [Cryomyces antarcticus]KAK5020391.1 hypothetical protein LTR60_000553 [Cryomyces antarcticus]KAK5295318.1 hypothetical protein LTR16_001135 [Cryomyces antarcticus]